ncbi:hypothetical protein ASC97_17455 [Rhizobium sp. Root1203]|nr:hypothetical protein ASC97_17455 [Rhizobium sp. Root1203]
MIWNPRWQGLRGFFRFGLDKDVGRDVANDFENLTAGRGLREEDIPLLLAALVGGRVALSSGAVQRAASRWVTPQRMVAIPSCGRRGFLSTARLIGRAHMGSDLRRFIVATSYLTHVS